MSLKEAQQLYDAARRLSDIVSQHMVDASDVWEIVGKWCAFHLDNGVSDGNIYLTKDDAIRHQSNPKSYCYLKLTPDGITPKDAMHFLRINRHPMIDTTSPEHVINPAIYPRFSNLSPAQKRELKRQSERHFP